MRAGPIVLLLIASSLLPTIAQTQGEDRVEAMLRRGLTHRRAGRLTQAASLFEQAYELESSPRVAVQLGITLAQLERWVEAERYLLEAKAEPDDEYVQRRHEAIERALGVIREHLGSIEIRGGEPGARVLVDGTDRGSLPLPPIRVVHGEHRVEVLASTGPVRRQLLIEEGSPGLIELPVFTPEPVSEDGPPDLEAAELDESSTRYLAGGGATLGFAMAGLVLGAVSSRRIQVIDSDAALLEARAMTPSTDGTVCDDNALSRRVRNLCDRYPRLRALQATGYVAAGLGLAATALLAWAWARRANDHDSGEQTSSGPRWRLGVGVDRRAGSLRLSARF